jgi:hypothetical protein
VVPGKIMGKAVENFIKNGFRTCTAHETLSG